MAMFCYAMAVNYGSILNEEFAFYIEFTWIIVIIGYLIEGIILVFDRTDITMFRCEKNYGVL